MIKTKQPPPDGGRGFRSRSSCVFTEQIRLADPASVPRMPEAGRRFLG